MKVPVAILLTAGLVAGGAAPAFTADPAPPKKVAAEKNEKTPVKDSKPDEQKKLSARDRKIIEQLDLLLDLKVLLILDLLEDLELLKNSKRLDGRK